jgi:hypothetical protein
MTKSFYTDNIRVIGGNIDNMFRNSVDTDYGTGSFKDLKRASFMRSKDNEFAAARRPFKN